jgi:hypothetical protein
MMTPNMLERATPGYRRGYNDAINYREPATLFNGPWEKQDYCDGYRAGMIERR